MHIIPNPEPKEVKLDLKAGHQIFDKERTREDGRFATIPKDTENPIDVRIRQMSMESLDGSIDLKREFYNKNIAVLFGNITNLKVITGKIKDIFLHSRDVYVKTRKGNVYIVPFDKVMEISEREL